MRKLISTMMMCVLVLGICISVPSVAQAEEATEVYIDDSDSSDEEQSTVILYPTLRGVYLLKGTGTLTVPFNATVGCYGTTTANYAVYKVYVGVSLEYYSNGTWTSVATFSETEYNDYFVSAYKLYSVTGGYYYRVKTEHWAATDWTMGATNGIWVSK